MAIRPPEIHPEALEEADAAVLWYLERSHSAALQFITALDDAISLIAKTPDRWPTYAGGTRRYIMRKFPYFVVYRFTQDAVHVYAVAHAKRRPGYWKQRLGWRGSTAE